MSRAGEPRAHRLGLALVLGGIAAAATGCAGDLDPAWQLSHDRIVAVRATPPGIASGERSTIDALLAAKDGPTRVAPPQAATVLSPMSLSDALAFDGAHWVVTAPSADRLAAARSELKLAADAPVPLEVGVSYAGQTLVATKEVALGRHADNPALIDVLIDGKPAPDAAASAAPDTAITVAKLVPVPLSIDADDTVYDVTWLTSCGTMHDFDLPSAHLQVEADDPDAGELAVVLRDGTGGVSWQVWSIRAQ